MKAPIWILFALLLSACAPSERIIAEPDKARLLLQGGEKEDQVQLNDRALGALGQYTGRTPLAIPVSAGTHQLTILRDGQVIYTETLYIDGDVTKTVRIQ
ncbi:PEGA domain-containing protein [Ferrimonas gelatinilytica]|uniref:PEGA domain-containing protein n=1 Tax=Ferrimonas gelatinilytica TaxID=1255257 RepID=A0ABP9SAE1_9GAMM